MISYGSVFILGLAQGLTELWPISSSAHLFLVPYFMNWPDFGLTMTVFLHLGTLLAVVIYLARDWWKILTKDRSLLWLILVATIPAALAGFFLEDLAETAFRSPVIIAVNLIVFGILLGLADRYGSKIIRIKQLNWPKGLIIGLAQAIALIPGVSRSGITMTAGLFTGLKRDQTAKFSFLMLSPVLLGAFLLRLSDLLDKGTEVVGGSLISALIGFGSSFIFSYLALVFLFKIIKKTSFWPFVVYRIILGVIVLLIYLW